MDRSLCVARGGCDHGRQEGGLGDLARGHRRGATGQEMSRGDQLVDRAANSLQQMADRAATEGGVKEKLAQELADDAAFLRKLKPSLIVARAKGEAPTNQKPSQGHVAPSGPQLGKRPKPKRAKGPNPFVVLGLAFAAGIVIAKIVDWRGHAHPRN